MNVESLCVAVIDIGKLENLGWVVEGPTISRAGTDIEVFIEVLVTAMNMGPLALGFEAPMFVPYGRSLSDLDKARQGDGDRAFSASVGASVLTKGLVIVPYILERLRQGVRHAEPTFGWREPLSHGDLLLLEAFVTHMGKSASHEECARMALNGFPRGFESRASFESAVSDTCTLNLLGAILLRMGWTDDLSVLAEPCMVVRHKGDSKGTFREVPLRS